MPRTDPGTSRRLVEDAGPFDKLRVIGATVHAEPFATVHAEPFATVRPERVEGTNGAQDRSVEAPRMVNGRRPSLAGTHEVGRATVIGTALVKKERL